MALKKREKILAAATVALALLVVGKFLFSAWWAPLQRLSDRRNSLLEEVAKKQARIDRSLKAQDRIEQFNRRSLPADPQVAKSLYQNWIFKLADEVGFRGTKVDVTGEGKRQGDVYRALRFSVQTQGSLAQLTEFLYKFYSAGHLHQIRTLTIQPLEKSSELDVRFSVEALSLPGCDRTDELTQEKSDLVAAADLGQFRTAIADRNVFAPYKPSPPPPPVSSGPPAPPAPPKFDPCKYAYVTAIVGVNDRPQLWLIARTSGKKYILSEGDRFELGDIRARVVQINLRDAEIEFDGKRWLVPMGDSLRDAIPLFETPADAAQPSEAAALAAPAQPAATTPPSLAAVPTGGPIAPQGAPPPDTPAQGSAFQGPPVPSAAAPGSPAQPPPENEAPAPATPVQGETGEDAAAPKPTPQEAPAEQPGAQDLPAEKVPAEPAISGDHVPAQQPDVQAGAAAESPF